MLLGPPPPADQTPDAEGKEPRAPVESWTSWLNRNERETWQMELLIAGFAIVLLAQGFEPVGKHLTTIRAHAGDNFVGNSLAMGATVGILFAMLITSVSLSVSVLMRGLWVAAVGLRSVSGDIDLTQIKLAPRFRQFLQRRLPKFDDYIVSLERICSSIFSLAFLTLFTLLGVIMASLLIVLPVHLLVELFGEAVAIPLGIAAVVFLLLVLVSTVDFVTGGYLKRWRAFSAVYYPVYRFIGWITLARFYRPLYYNLVDSKVGRFVVAGVIPYFAIVVVLFVIDGAGFTELIPRDRDFGFGSNRRYASESNFYLGNPFLGGRVAKDGYAELYLPLEYELGARVVNECLAEGERYREGVEQREGPQQMAALLKAYVSCLGTVYELQVDGTVLLDVQYAAVEYADSEQSFLYTVLSTDTLAAGRHYVGIYEQYADSLHHRATIPFFVP